MEAAKAERMQGKSRSIALARRPRPREQFPARPEQARVLDNRYWAISSAAPPSHLNLKRLSLLRCFQHVGDLNHHHFFFTLLAGNAHLDLVNAVAEPALQIAADQKLRAGAQHIVTRSKHKLLHANPEFRQVHPLAGYGEEYLQDQIAKVIIRTGKLGHTGAADAVWIVQKTLRQWIGLDPIRHFSPFAFTPR